MAPDDESIVDRSDDGLPSFRDLDERARRLLDAPLVHLVDLALLAARCDPLPPEQRDRARAALSRDAADFPLPALVTVAVLLARAGAHAASAGLVDYRTSIVPNDVAGAVRDAVRWLSARLVR